MPGSLLVVAGDASGDLHGSALIREIKRLDPSIKVAALGGDRMKEVSDRFLFDLVSTGASGFGEPIRNFFSWTRRLDLVRAYLDNKRPDAVLTIDFYGFNHQVLGLARHRGIQTLYYISPQIWASRPGRVKRLARLVRHMMLIFPFELDLYRKAGVPCTFVGHPLLERIPEPAQREYDPDKEVVLGILPGSRMSEVRKHTPLFIEAFKKIRAELPKARGILIRAGNIPQKTFDDLLGGPVEGLEIVQNTDYKFRRQCDFALTSSGTATLENALLGIPMIVAYKIGWFTYWIARMIIRVPYIAMANILAGKVLVPELIQADANPDTVAAESLKILTDRARMKALKAELAGLRAKLGESGASERAARIVLDHLN